MRKAGPRFPLGNGAEAREKEEARREGGTRLGRLGGLRVLGGGHL